MFAIQAILDTINQLSWHLITFGTYWPQELPVEHMVVLQSNKNTWQKNHNANTVPSYAVEAT